MGPTASGKTAVAVELAQTLPVEIISVDSALVYRDMNIGTAKPDAATLARAPHHLIDIRDPTEAYSAAAFRHDALHLMQDITQRGKIPLLVGGTMLYFKALREGLSDLPQADPEVRAALDAEIAQHGIQHLHRQLAEIDAETAARLKPSDTQRIQRAMEIYRITGQPMSALLKKPRVQVPSPASGRGLGRGQPDDETTSSAHHPLPQPLSHSWERGEDQLPYRILSIALIPGDRAQLHSRIAIRFKSMLELGLVAELRALRNKYPLHPNLPSMRCVGYRQAWQYIEGEITEAQLLETGIAATRQLAKRQLTWLRSMPDNIELDCLAPDIVRTVFDALTDNL
ncbi:MAG: tRNA (adenosine(37)-N6)-dimethylallyltransferase MiaA [Gallionella sp.]|nr:tRNA (adenosine(37)-N6)-dimethylallyltransferase MiaA [Gallionella sp.]